MFVVAYELTNLFKYTLRERKTLLNTDRAELSYHADWVHQTDRISTKKCVAPGGIFDFALKVLEFALKFNISFDLRIFIYEPLVFLVEILRFD